MLKASADLLSLGLEQARENDSYRRRFEELARDQVNYEQLAYATSHDLREPLRMVTIYAQLLSKRHAGELGTEANEYIGYMVEASSRMTKLLEDSMRYTRVAQAAEETSETSSESALRWALVNLQPAILESSAAITYDPLPVLPASPSHLVQLFQELIGNSIKYRSEEFPRIHISARMTGAEWHFAVADNGIGIDPRYADRIFGIFQRLHGQKYPGCGIGLAICKRIVERHGGRIWVESELDKGATFHFSLPAA